MNQFIQSGNFIFAVDNVAYIRYLQDGEYAVQVCFKDSPCSSWVKLVQKDWDARRYVDVVARPMPSVTDETSLVDMREHDLYPIM